MGRTILADERLQTYVQSLIQSNTWYLGLVIGKLSSQKDYVVHMARTPEPMEDQASDDGYGEENKPSKVKSPKKPTSLESMDEVWAATHAKQVNTMLPGGLNVIGVFAVAPPSMMQNAQVKLRQVLFNIYKQEKKNVQQFASGDITDRVLIQICLNTKKMTCRTIDVSESKNAFHPAEWKYARLSERWTQLESNLAFQIPIDIPGKSTSNLAKQLQTSLQPFYSGINASMVLINDTVRNYNEPLDQSNERKHTDKKSKSKDRSTSQHTYKCKVLSKMVNLSIPVEPSVTEISTELVIKGLIHSRAYVTGKPTVEDAITALKQDVIRSVSCRCELLCDDLQLVEEDSERREVHSTPRRVFYRIDGTSIDLCDYIFQDEKVSEVVKRIGELLDIHITEKDLDMSCEQPATEEDCSLYDQAEDEKEEVVSMETVKAETNSVKYYLIAGVGGLVGLFAAGFSFLLSENT